uniref:Uncharacterized protein n=1 Tax=Rhizophora mucronata TaxID=61149 RepID=A0A2P2Q7V2_RHIMU
MQKSFDFYYSGLAKFIKCSNYNVILEDCNFFHFARLVFFLLL